MSTLPRTARRYLDRCVSPELRELDVVEVAMEGRIKLGERWFDFESTLEVGALSAFRWRAQVHRGPLRISGHDEYRAGHGEMVWRLYGLLPVVHADDPDITHSARGRAAMEQVFLPAALARPDVTWTELDDGWLRASWLLDGEDVAIELQVDATGALRGVRMQRWSDAEGEPWHPVTFGAEVEGEVRAGGLVVPEHVVAGWFYGTPRWEEGRFFEARVLGLRGVPALGARVA